MDLQGTDHKKIAQHGDFGDETQVYKRIWALKHKYKTQAIENQAEDQANQDALGEEPTTPKRDKKDKVLNGRITKSVTNTPNKKRGSKQKQTSDELEHVE